MKNYLLIYFIIIFNIYAHDLEHQIKREGNCFVVQFYFSDNTKFSYEEYEIYRENEDTPFQIGRTDALGRVVFCPDKEGTWTLKVFSKDGHGAILKISSNHIASTSTKNSMDRVNQILLSILLILGILVLLKYL